MDTASGLVVDHTESILYEAQPIAIDVEQTSTDIPFAQFAPLIKDITNILRVVVTNLYGTAQHNKNIVKPLMERISAVNSTVSILQDSDLYTSNHYADLQKLAHVLQNMKKYIEEITQYNTVQKFLGNKTIETQFKYLCKEYDNSINLLNFNLFKFNARDEDKILKEDIEELLKFQAALAESIHDVVIETNDKKIDVMNALIAKVSEMAIFMQNLDGKRANQKKIDNIFHETLLRFEEFEETDDAPRSGRLRKYIHIRTRQDFAFKIVDEEHINQVKNQVTILKNLRDCQNIIHFYGLTSNGYLVTEWTEGENLREYISKYGQGIDIKLRMRFAYDIAKGLNFINAVKFTHREIRSENIVITDNNVAKLTNFQLIRSDKNFYDKYIPVRYRDYIRYSSPELLRGEMVGIEKKYDTKCAVYSFGMVLWEIGECRTPFEELDDYVMIANKVVGGYREPFTPDTAVPKKYQVLVTEAISQNPGFRPTLAKMLTDLQDIFNDSSNYAHEHSLKSNRPPITPPVRKESVCAFDWASFGYKTIDYAIEEHKSIYTDKSILYKCFNAYANMGNPKAKYWKAYYITKGLSDLICSQDEKENITVKLFKEAADYGNEFPNAKFFYATMAMQGKGIEKNEKEAIEYLLEAAKNDHVVAMYSAASYYFSTGDKASGKYYIIMAAEKGHDQVINYCRAKNLIDHDI